MHEAMHERERLTPELKVGDFEETSAPRVRCTSSIALRVSESTATNMSATSSEAIDYIKKPAEEVRVLA